MKSIIAIALAGATLVAGATAADAREGCGPGGHRNGWGDCRPNRGPVVVAPGLVVGNYYHGRGYWDGRRYWHHRERWNNGWRYR